MNGQHCDSKKAVAAIFNSAVAATAISAAWEIGLFEKLQSQGTVCLAELAEQQDLDPDSLRGLASTLAVVNVVRRDTDKIVPGVLFDEANRTKSLFHWLTVGSGELFSRAPYLFARSVREGDFYRRDAKAIAHACNEINREFVDPVFYKVLAGLEGQFHAIADLGCGNGERLMQILSRHTHTMGIGIDIARPAIEHAREQATQRGMSHRLSFMKGDVCELTPSDEFAGVDLLTCFFVGHDFWPREHCIATLDRLRHVFPKVRRLILGDVTRVLLNNSGTRDAVPETEPPIFTLGFEFGHALMGVNIPTLDDWEGVFGAGGWRCLSQHVVEPPSRAVIFELEPGQVHQ